MEIEEQQLSEEVRQEAEGILGQFTFQKTDPNEKKTRSSSRRRQKTEAYLQAIELENEENKDTEEPPGEKKTVKRRGSNKKLTPQSTMEDDDMPPPSKSDKKGGKKKGVVSDSKKIKDELKEKQLEDTATYLFNYLKEAKTNRVNKTSLKKCFKGLLIDNINEDQADMMLNFPNLDPKNLVKEELDFDDFKEVVRLCNFKFDVDGNLL